ncbi:DUF222 domain-containing protein [Oryzobacter terrae]|uniref:HNH endonuclease n=1 Tax=Oryzobacter terrae TaxID=1620385 RepID=UPI00366F5768
MDRADVVSFREDVALLAGPGSPAAQLTDRERLDLVAELERVKGAVAAAQARLTHALRRSREELDLRDVARSVGSEVALARRCSPSLGDRFVGLARALVDEMPATMSALSSGACSERHAVVVARATAVLPVEARAEVDRRVGPLLGRLGVTAAERAAHRVAAELDAAAVVRRMEEAVRSRRVTVRPAPDGMAYLSVLGQMVDVVGTHAALLARARSVVGGQCADELPGGRGVGAVAADTALRALSGRGSPGAVQPVEVHVVMTDRALLGIGDPQRSVMEPARVPGHGSVPASVIRSVLRRPFADARPRDSSTPTTSGVPDRADSDASVWLRRLHTSPDGRDLVAMDARRRLFTGLLRRMLVLRDDVCVTPWCGAPIVHADHLEPARDGGPTSFVNGSGACARCNQVKEAPGWSASVHDPLTSPEARVEDGLSRPRREVVVATPSGRRYVSSPPPLLGWGTDVVGVRPTVHRDPAPAGAGTSPPRRHPRGSRPPKRPLLSSRLERTLCRSLT